MTWYTEYLNDTVEQIEGHASAELAIEAACQLIESGSDVHRIGNGQPEDSLGRAQIARTMPSGPRRRNRSGRTLPFVQRTDSRHYTLPSSSLHR
jgi:hypothetical protein